MISLAKSSVASLLCTLLLSLTPAQLSAESPGSVAVGARPSGALDGKIVYAHGGHGYFAANEGNGAWFSQRPLLLGMVEDLGNKDQMDLFIDCLFRCGATVVPLRPVGHQPLEVVLDNSDPDVTYTGDWEMGKGDVYFGAPDAPYLVATTSKTETAVAAFKTNLPEPGRYPVYAWTPSGKDHAPDQLYRVRHSGGATEVRVNHRRVGDGLVYLGTYYFDTSATVEVSNQSSVPGAKVIADMIRFGNGRGAIARGGGVSGFDREHEAGLYWVMWHAERSHGVPESSYRKTDIDRDAAVSFAPRYSAHMNREAAGPATDRVYVSFHSNAGGGKARGVLGLYNGNNYKSSRTPHQLLLADTLASHVNQDMVARAGQFEHDWHDRGEKLTLDRTDIEFGEINNKYIHDEFDATIVETGFHDNKQDAQMLRDPSVRMALAQASCRGLIKYFHEVDGGKTPHVAPPAPVAALSAHSTLTGTVTLRWKPTETSPYAPDAAEGYIVYTSLDGRGFDSGRLIEGGKSTGFTATGLNPQGLYFFRIAAKNQGGESRPSEVLACRPRATGHKVLLVNGFDRLDRRMNREEKFLQEGMAERARPLENNARNYLVAAAKALQAAASGLGVASASNEAVLVGLEDLAAYDAVVYQLGEESTKGHTFDPGEQSLVSEYVSRGGKLFVSGSDIAWDLDHKDAGRFFCYDVLHTSFVANDADTYRASGTSGGIFDGLSLSFEKRPSSYDVESPDVLAAEKGAKAAITYQGSNKTAAVQFANGDQRVLCMAIPFEAINQEATRAEVMRRVIAFFELSGPAAE